MTEPTPISTIVAWKLRYYDGRSLPIHKEYEDARVKEIAILQKELDLAYTKLDNELMELAIESGWVNEENKE